MERSLKKSSSLLKRLESYLSSTRASPAKKPTKANKRQVAPTGCFPVYVGPEKQRFAIKTEYANHPLFKMLLEDAELEYGFATEGPLILPCGVDLFCRVLAEMEYSGEDDDQIYDNNANIDSRRCGFAYGGCSPFNSPARRLGKGGGGSYGLLNQPRLLKINNHQFY